MLSDWRRQMGRQQRPTRRQTAAGWLAIVTLLQAACGSVASAPPTARGAAPTGDAVAAQPAERMGTAPDAQLSEVLAAGSPVLPAAAARLVYAHGSAGAP